MFYKSKRMSQNGASAERGVSCKLLTAAAALVFVLGSVNASLATNYSFLSVTSTGTASSKFTSAYGNGVINVTDVFSAGGAGADNNNNALIFPSQFTTLFPGTGQVQGHLAQTVYNHTSVITFDLTGYNLSPSTVFGMWNTTDEVTQPAYRVQLINSSNVQVNPTTFNLIGNQDNITPLAHHRMVMNTATGDITAGILLNSSGIHTDAAFWKNIPVGTKKIIVYGNLPPLNNIGDGVGYYFAEVIPAPEPSSLGLTLFGSGTLLFKGRIRSRGSQSLLQGGNGKRHVLDRT